MQASDITKCLEGKDGGACEQVMFVCFPCDIAVHSLRGSGSTSLWRSDLPPIPQSIWVGGGQPAKKKRRIPPS